jgi:hypothetical protein
MAQENSLSDYDDAGVRAAHSVMLELVRILSEYREVESKQNAIWFWWKLKNLGEPGCASLLHVLASTAKDW